MNEQYFFVRKLGLGKEVVSLSLVVTEVAHFWTDSSLCQGRSPIWHRILSSNTDCQRSLQYEQCHALLMHC